jgi:formate transporter FocA
VQNIPRFDALLPPAMAVRAEETGVNKAFLDWPTMTALALLAGGFISLGAVFATTVTAGSAGVAPYGVARLLAGLVFSLGLILVVVGGAELFTGNTLMVMAWADRRITLRRVLRNWAIVFAGNFAGALATAGLMFVSQQHAFGGGAVGAAALAIAQTKVGFGFAQAVALGVLCNVLVCLAVWLTLSARTTTDRILAVVFPISAFVAAGFEHSVANMYFVPIGLLIKEFAAPEFWAAIAGTPEQYATLTWWTFLSRNLVPVTIGNVIGGGVMVGAVYWFVYLRPHPARAAADVSQGGAETKMPVGSSASRRPRKQEREIREHVLGAARGQRILEDVDDQVRVDVDENQIAVREPVLELARKRRQDTEKDRPHDRPNHPRELAVHLGVRHSRRTILVDRREGIRGVVFTVGDCLIEQLDDQARDGGRKDAAS